MHKSTNYAKGIKGTTNIAINTNKSKPIIIDPFAPICFSCKENVKKCNGLCKKIKQFKSLQNKSKTL